MPETPQIGEVGLSYCYGGNKINFPTNNKYPFVSVTHMLFRKEHFTPYLSLWESKILLVYFSLCC